MGGLQDSSVSPRPIGFGFVGFRFVGFGAKGVVPGLDNYITNVLIGRLDEVEFIQ